MFALTMSKRLMLVFFVGALLILVLSYLLGWGPIQFFLAFVALLLLIWKYNIEEIEEKKLNEEVRKAREFMAAQGPRPGRGPEKAGV